MLKLDNYPVWKDLKKDMDLFEKYLYKISLSGEPLVSAAVEHLLRAGGKRMRPAFAMITARIYDCPLDRLLPLLASLELVHTASLVHDDVIDGSPRRRGLPTINEMHGDPMAIATGDFIVGAAIRLLTNYGDKRVLDSVLSTISEMCNGEVRQIEDFYFVEQGYRNYLYRIQRKTALLFSVSCYTGALVSGASEAESRALERFGYYLGMAFQVRDDILDMIGDEKVLGKPVGSDLRSGNLSLPAIYALKNSPKRELLAEKIAAKPTDAKDIKEIIDIIVDCGAIDFSDRFAECYMDKALRKLDFVPQNEYTQLLRAGAKEISKRKY